MRRLSRARFAFTIVASLILVEAARSQVKRLTDHLIPHTPDGRATVSSLEVPEAARLSVPAASLDPEAMRLANQIIQEEEEPPFAAPQSDAGGLWLSGDVAEALERLRWIVGPGNAEALVLSAGGEVKLDVGKLTRLLRIKEYPYSEGSLVLATHISANEGLLLLLQITTSSHRYLLHIGRRTLTEGGEVVVTSAMNLDNKFDSRINPRRRKGLKLGCERPPTGFDSLIAINPATRWLNLEQNLLLHPGSVTFHELAESYARIEFGFDYLAEANCPGAHETAVTREDKLLIQRPSTVITRGLNLVLPEGQPMPPLPFTLMGSKKSRSSH